MPTPTPASPTPWTWEYRGNIQPEVHDADGSTVCEPLTGDDAARIVHAVNAFPALVAALREIAKGEGAFSRDPLTHAANCLDSMKEIARAALARAEGR